MRKKTNVFLFLLMLLLTPTSHARIPFFGKTQHGKTTLINISCGLSLPVAKDGQSHSTTPEITEHACLNNTVIDTIGLFHYNSTNPSQFGLKEIMELILEYVEQEKGLSGFILVWGTREAAGSGELEKIFETLCEFFHNLPMAIVQNQFASFNAEYPKQLSLKYKLPLLKVDLNDVSQLQSWIKKTTSFVRVKLPPDWRNYLEEFNYKGLRNKIFELSLLACDTVKLQLENINQQRKTIQQPQEQCNYCSQDCRTTHTRRCGFLWSETCTSSWIDTHCNNQALSCFSDCKKNHGKNLEMYQQIIQDLNTQERFIWAPNADILNTCDTFKLSEKKKSEEEQSKEL